MDFVLTPEWLAMVGGVILSLLFSYIPKFNEWYAALATTKKSLIMAACILLISLAVYAATCLKIFDFGIACGTNGVIELVRIFVLTLIANQGTYVLSPQTAAAKLAKENR